ncbi:Adenine deaminase [Cercospora zeina]
MCSPEFKSFLKSLPKCEHHMHLEGALTPEVLFALANKNNIILLSDDPAFASPESLLQRYDSFTSLDDFLHYYYIGMSVLTDASDFESLAWDYFKHAHADGVVHAELFFDPQAHLCRNISYNTILTGFKAARERAHSEFGITSELICCFLRHLPAPECHSTFNLPEIQASYQRKEVLGIGLDSSEKGFPPENFDEIYKAAKALGLRLTAHAGEEGPADYVKTALEVLGIERIDHGIRLAEDPDLLARVAKSGTLLTVCPLSNVLLRCVPQVSELPIRKFIQAGVKFSINSDDPAYFGNNYILDNYVAVQEAFGLTVEEWETICRNAIEGSWCCPSRKDEMLLELQKVVEAWLAAHHR